MPYTKKARRKVLYSGVCIHQKLLVIKFTGMPGNIKNINNNFLPECCFVEKEESGLFYLNTSNKLLFFVCKKRRIWDFLFKYCKRTFLFKP